MSQSYTCLRYHIVFGTKGRRPFITAEIQQRLYDYLGGIIRHEDGRLLAAGGTADHVHLLVGLHPKTSVVEAMRLVKSNSSKWIHETFPALAEFTWQTGYAAFSVSQSNVEAVTRYIHNQQEHHKRATFEEEYVAFLQRHEIVFDPKYLWK